MFCEKCGNELKGNATFCISCGAKIDAVKKGNSGNNMESNNVHTSDNNKIPRDMYIGKAYTFDFYMGLNLRCLRISRRAAGFDEDNLLYCKGLSKKQIPYNLIKEVRDEIKTSTYAVICFVVVLLLGILFIFGGLIPYTPIAAVLAVIFILFRKCRVVSIVTRDNQVFSIKAVPKNKEVDQFIMYLKNETGIK